MSQAILGLHLRTHQTISDLGGTLSVGGGLLTGRSFLSSVIEIAEDWRSKKCGLGDIFCECDALAGVIQRVLVQSNRDAANIRVWRFYTRLKVNSI